MAVAQWIFDVDEQNFQEVVIEQSHKSPVLIDFWSERCAPCRTIGPMLEKLTREHQGAVILAKIAVDDAQMLAGQFGIEYIPALRVVKDGKLVWKHDGALPEAQLRDLFTQLAQLSGTRADPLLVKAREFEEKEKHAEAEPLYRKMLEKEPTDELARVSLARVLAAQKKDDEVLGLLEPVDVDGPQGAEAQRIRSVLSLRGLSATSDEATLRKQIADNPKSAQPRYELGCLLAQQGKHEEALEMLLSAGERDTKLASTKVREAMVQVFYALGPSHPLSNTYRSKLAIMLS